MDSQSSNQPQAQPTESRSSLRRFGLVLLGLGTVMVGLLAIGLLPRLQRQAQLNATAKEAATSGLTVNTITAHRADAKAELELPGNIQAVQETTIYSRTSGYLKQRSVDIGDRVSAGQLLAEIDSPETDRELDQARANLAQTRSAYMQAQATVEQARASLTQVQTNSDLARLSSQRWQELQKQGAVPRQDLDEKQAAFKASQANVQAAQSVINANRSNADSALATIRASEANVQRLESLQAYKTITAPFAGIITGRNVDTGALITAGSGGSNAVWLYKIAQPETLRIVVQLPQAYVESIRVGQTAKILVRELPKQVFSGKVTRTANALDQTSHTLLTEVQVSNPGLKLLPGMYAQVKFVLQRATIPLMVPANAIAIRNDGPQVAIVKPDHTIHYQKIAIGRDYGTEVEVVSGLTGTEQLVVNPTDEVTEGAQVHAVPVQPKSAA